MGDLDDKCEWDYLDNARMTRVATRLTCVTRMTGLTRISRMTGVTLMYVMSVIT